MDAHGESEEMAFELVTGPLSHEDVVAFAQFLGMHPIRDKELLWFAEESDLD